MPADSSKARDSSRGVIIAWALMFIAMVFPGCGSDSDVPVVDFSKTLAVERPEEETGSGLVLKVAVGAMISPKETFIYYRQLLEFLGEKMGRNIQLVQRKTYEEINELLGKGDIDLAFICSGPYVLGKEQYGFELLATPVVQGSHFYRAYLIVNRESPFKSLDDLRGRVFAFTDPDSNTGRLVPIYWLAKRGEDPETFFGKTIYTYGHDNSILAVARALVDGATVDGLIWEYYNQRDPVFTARTRIIKKSEPYGIPPIVVSKYPSEKVKEQARRLLLSMHLEEKGRIILKELMIDRFMEPREEWYASIRHMQRVLRDEKSEIYVSQKP
ncbi:MAG: phosphate/phosphite/phosphonate ABC transporter substrate-binding protein [Deltaproteobacteria bacterium]|nr:phosphate/phosphite/phosphonate ABC transporter substrate-binding protein [Deltaproteobacteria bacterium]